jgi:Domain of unknown function (DUF3883)
MEAVFQAPVLFAKLGWMKYYDGPKPCDPKPIGGGKNNRANFGHEGFNFRQYGDRLMGSIKTGAEDGGLRLQRIIPSPVSGNRIRGAIVIFVSTRPGLGGQKIVGWYRNATIYAERIEYDPNVAEQMLREVTPHFPRFRPSGYLAECDGNDAVLLPLKQRQLQQLEFPKKHGIGEANVSYPFDERGSVKRERADWIRKALDYVSSCSGPNLPTESGVEEEIEAAVALAAEKRNGFQSNPQIRHEVEQFAMECAKKYLVRRKYKNIVRTDDRHCYDYTCTDNGKTVYVEVKGTQTRGDKIIVTKNEKANLEAKPDTILYIRHSIDVSGSKRISISGGVERVLNRWNPRSGSCVAETYTYTPGS